MCFLSQDGKVRVSEICDSREQLEAFGERLMPLLAEIGIDPGEPEILRAPHHRPALASFARRFTRSVLVVGRRDVRLEALAGGAQVLA